jgi:hypothetical protein
VGIWRPGKNAHIREKSTNSRETKTGIFTFNLGIMKGKKNELKMLERCANGEPYFLIVQHGDIIDNYCAPGFDISLIFKWLKQLMIAFPQYQNEYANEIIELSQTLNK